MESKYELLAPAGDFSMLSAAVNAGADAVYFGIKGFNMRVSAKNFTLEDLDKIRKICNSSPRKVKMYLTMNIIVYDEEVERVEEILKKVKGKVDAIICWDLSVINLCRKHKIPFHISTQASVSNSEAAKFYKELGAERIVLARELNLEQVKKISKIIDIETFCHGAMCLAISGRCLMSQHTFGKSANRGECVQNCRRSYIIKDKQEGYELEVENNRILSAKDLCTLPFIEELKKAGVKSFKIEGRNRDARYVDAVVRVYRKALDKKLSEEEIKEGLDELKKVYNRGFSSGFYLGSPTSDDFSKTENSAATEKKEYVGKIYNYLSKSEVALIKVSKDFKVGDDIIVIGNETGIEKIKVERMEIHNQPVEFARKGDEVGIKIPKVKKNNEVYVVRKVL